MLILLYENGQMLTPKTARDLPELPPKLWKNY
jgi:hypothetical protein